MTMSSKKELVEPYDKPEQVLHSLRKLFKTTSFDHSNSPEFELFSDHESMQEVILFYKGLDVPTRQILDSKEGVLKISAPDAKKSIQEMVDYSQKWHDGTFTRSKSSNTSDGLLLFQAQIENYCKKLK
ncbi:hypothetical protein Tco_0618357 [Tanacetum coccineum]